MLAPMDELCRLGPSLVDLIFENKKGSIRGRLKVSGTQIAAGLMDEWPGS